MSDRFFRLFRAPGSPAIPPFEPSQEHSSLAEQVADRIMSLVRAGDLKAGDRLPTESQMALALGISRPPLREALKALVLMGVLESRQGSRYSVTDLSPHRLVEPFNVMLSGRNFDPVPYHEVRCLVDLECVRLCVEHAGPEGRAEIRRFAEEGFAFAEDPPGYRAMDALFHGAVYAGCGNTFLETMARGLYTTGTGVRRDTVLLPSVILRSCEEHRRVADAISAGEGEAAVAAYRRHLESIRDATIEVLSVQKALRG